MPRPTLAVDTIERLNATIESTTGVNPQYLTTEQKILTLIDRLEELEQAGKSNEHPSIPDGVAPQEVTRAIEQADDTTTGTGDGRH